MIDRPWASEAHGPTPTALRGWFKWARVLLLGVGVALAVWAQVAADKRRELPLALAAYLVGAVLYAVTARIRCWEQPSTIEGPRPVVHRAWVIWALVFAGLAFASLGGNHFSFQGVLAWGLSVLLGLAALSGTVADSERLERPQRRLGAAWRNGTWRVSWITLGLIAAVVIGAALRFYRLLEIPADLGWDLPYNDNDVRRILAGEYLIFFPDNMGREGLFFYLAAAVAKGIGPSPYALRITSALIGLLAIPAVYALGRECAGREVGVYAALLLALNKWHIVLTRSGYRVSLMPLFAILALYGLARGLRRGGARDWAWCGLVLGLGLWTYKAFTFAYPVVIGCALVYAAMGLLRPQRARGATSGELSAYWAARPRAVLAGLGLALLLAIIVAMPMIRFVVDSPKVYLAREMLGSELVDESLAAGASRWALYARNTAVSLLMFNYEGDGNSRFGVPFQRHLGFVSGILWVLGMAIAIARVRRGGNALLVLGTLGLLVPMTISLLVGETPNCFRSSGVIGPALVLAASALATLRREVTAFVSGAWLVLRGLGSRLPALRVGLVGMAIPVILVGGLFFHEARETTRYYFHDFRRIAPNVANYSVALEMAQTLISFGEGPSYIKIWPHWYDGRAVAVHLNAAGRGALNEALELRAGEPPLAGTQGQVLVLLHPEDHQALATLKASFPRWTTQAEHDPEGNVSFVAFYGER